jgi:hypothetical protein
MASETTRYRKGIRKILTATLCLLTCLLMGDPQYILKILPWSDRVTDLKTVAIAPCLFERTEQLEFIDTHRTKAVRRYDLNFQIPCFHGQGT